MFVVVMMTDTSFVDCQISNGSLLVMEVMIYALMILQMANNLLQQVQQLKIMIEQVKQQTLISKESVIQQTRQMCEKEKNEVSGCFCESMIKLEGLQVIFVAAIASVHDPPFVGVTDILSS